MKQKISKKAFTTPFIGVTILAVIVLIVLLSFYSNVVSTGKNVGRKEICKRSVELSNSLGSIHLEPKSIEGKITNFLVDSFGNPVKIDCSTSYVNFRSKDQDVIMKNIADEMVDCWDMFGEGKRKLFDPKDNTYCVVCSRLTFDNEVEVKRFIMFLKQNTAPYKGMTYWKHFMVVDVEDFETTYYENSNLSKYDNFKTDFPMAVMFVMEKEVYPHRPQMTISGMGYGSMIGSLVSTVGFVFLGPVGVIGSIATFTVGGATVGYIIGSDVSAEWDARILLWNYDKLKDLSCTYLEAKSTPLEVVQKE